MDRCSNAWARIARGIGQSLAIVGGFVLLGLLGLGAAWLGEPGPLASAVAAEQSAYPATMAEQPDEHPDDQPNDGHPNGPDGQPDGQPDGRPDRQADQPAHGEPDGEPELWLVDGFNVLNAAMLKGPERKGFWRRDARERLVSRVSGLARSQQICVVFDGQEPPAEDPPLAMRAVRVVFAPSADDWLLRSVREAQEPGRLLLVTADRSLADRARHAGARIVSPRAFLARCDADAPSESSA